MLAVTSFARSFKEAQAYLIPIILLSMGPGLMAMNPGLKLDGVFCLVPMVNVLLLGRDVINHDVQWLPALLAIASTVFYALVAIRFAAERFGGDGVLYANQGTLSELVSRPKESQSHFSFAAALLGLALLLPINLIAIGVLGRLATVLESQYTTFAFLMMSFTFLSFFCVPWLIAINPGPIDSKMIGIEYACASVKERAKLVTANISAEKKALNKTSKPKIFRITSRLNPLGPSKIFSN